MTTLCVLSRGIGGKDPTATPVARAQGRPGPRSHSPATTAEGPGALSSRRRAREPGRPQLVALTVRGTGWGARERPHTVPA